MGWWGVNVMEGDPPMDAESTIVQNLNTVRAERGLEYADPYEEDSDIWETLTLDGVASRILADINSDTTIYHEDDRNVHKQVLGEIIICNGFPLPEDVRQAAIEAARADEWASEGGERKAAMDTYIQRITDYNGTAVDPVSQGLFGKIVNG